MTKKQESLVYVFLTVVVLGLLGYLIYDINAADRGESIGDIREVLKERERAGKVEDATASGSSIFEQRDLLFPIITPEPTPTRVVLPTPTPTPVPFAEGWKIRSMTSKKASIVDSTGKSFWVNEGGEYFGVLIKSFNLKEKKILVEYIPDGLGRTKEITR